MFGFIDKAAERVVEKFFLDALKPFDVEDLKEAVKNNVSLLDEAAKYNSGSLSFAENMAKQFGGQSQLLTTDNVLEWIKEKRHELYFTFISDRKARNWLDRNIKEFKEFLFN